MSKKTLIVALFTIFGFVVIGSIGTLIMIVFGMFLGGSMMLVAFHPLITAPLGAVVGLVKGIGVATKNLSEDEQRKMLMLISLPIVGLVIGLMVGSFLETMRPSHGISGPSLIVNSPFFTAPLGTVIGLIPAIIIFKKG